jgi:hypothetical protein
LGTGHRIPEQRDAAAAPHRARGGFGHRRGRRVPVSGGRHPGQRVTAGLACVLVAFPHQLDGAGVYADLDHRALGRRTAGRFGEQRLQRVAHLDGARGALVAVLFQELHHELARLRGDALGQRRRLHRQLPRQDHDHVGVPERGLAAEHLVENQTQRVEIRSPIDLHSARLLRGHVFGGSEHRSELRERLLGLTRRA